MLGIILTGHGGFATGLFKAIKQILGEQPQFIAIDFPDGKSTDELEAELRQAVIQCDTCDGIVFLTDILGGSPFKTTAMLSFELQNAEVVTGTNLPLLIEMLFARDEYHVSEFREIAVESARSGVTSLWHENQKRASLTIEAEEDNGI